MFAQVKRRNFEQSLRARIFPVTPAQTGNNPGLNPEFHRGCTGKAHACGTMKSRLKPSGTTMPANSGSNAAAVAPSATPTSAQRKNSISSETISDSGSENSAPSWLDASDTNVKVAEAAKHTSLSKKPSLVRCGPTSGGKLTPVKLSPLQRNSPTPPRRLRLHSEGDRLSETGISTASSTGQQQQQQHQQQQQSSFERAQKYRSFRVGNNNSRKQQPAAAVARPPWNSGPAKATATVAATFGTRNYRNSFRRRDTVDWHAVWERSLAQRGSGSNTGVYKHFNEAIKRKVCIFPMNELNLTADTVT